MTASISFGGTMAAIIHPRADGAQIRISVGDTFAEIGLCGACETYKVESIRSGADYSISLRHKPKRGEGKVYFVTPDYIINRMTKLVDQSNGTLITA